MFEIKRKMILKYILKNLEPGIMLDSIYDKICNRFDQIKF